ncbi:HAD family hydrolase [Winogradskyella ouciana]|uniref:HAD-IA family hydrolase n=1 Tax=Winogradskyella ouciana TaxID=2608631 RepID=A0A7K1G8I2_9FLAO|nr:HAD family hydrolase [Winogradskyella ouciana]MTE25580.1 HAD-IA family hydrolase [Winogradskyella ouciana]
MDIKVDKHTVIVFDLDDTLYNEIEYLKSAYKFIANDLDPANRKSLYRNMFAKYRKGDNIFQYLANNYKVEVKDLIEAYRNHNPKISLFDDAYQTLTDIKRKGGNLAIITDGRVKTQMAKIEALGIKGLFSEIIISEALGTEKPNEQNFKVVEEAMPARIYYYIGDNISKDFVSPNAMGWKTIGLMDNGLNIHCQVDENLKEEFFPKFLIDSYKELNIV